MNEGGYKSNHHEMARILKGLQWSKVSPLEQNCTSIMPVEEEPFLIQSKQTYKHATCTERSRSNGLPW